MSKFTPLDDTEYKAMRSNVWPAGWYAAEITDEVTERMSANGNLMFEAQILVFNDSGLHKKVRTFIMAEGKAAFQLRSAAEAFGVLDEYKAGTLSEDDLKGKSGYVKLAVEVDPNGVYDDKNVIRDYRKSLPGTVKAADIAKPKPQPKAKTEADLDDSCPF